MPIFESVLVELLKVGVEDASLTLLPAQGTLELLGGLG